MDTEKYFDRKIKQIIEIPVFKGNLVEAMYTKWWGRFLREHFVKYPYFSYFYGKYMDTASSKSMIVPFINDYNIDIDMFCKSIDQFSSFNDFFYRKYKPGAIQINNNEDEFISPCDSRLMAFENIGSKLKFSIKGNSFSINGLTESDLIKYYSHGTLLIFRLTPLDYHRFHFPVSGIPEKSKKVGKYYYTVNPVSLSNNINVFLRNVREYCFYHTLNFGRLLYCEVGAVGVGGIHQTYEAGEMTSKGDEKGYYSFGASTVILLLEKGKIKVDRDILDATSNGLETQVKFGEKIAQRKK